MNVELFQQRYRDELGPDALKVLSRVDPAVQQMAAILDRMLGLATVHHATFERQKLDMTLLVRVVDRHGGRIRAEGVPGEKAAFYFTLESDRAEDPA